MPFWRLHYHVVWATKHRAPVIPNTMTPAIERSIAATSRDLGVGVHAVGVMPDHVHVFAEIPPTQTVAHVVGRWKGAASFAVNANRPDKLAKLAWQEGYGALSVSQSGFDRVLADVQKQRERHASRELYSMMERADDPTEGR